MGTNKRRPYRAWPESLKREIVAATWLPGASVSRVARRYDVNANQVFAWRRRYRDIASEPAELRLLRNTTVEFMQMRLISLEFMLDCSERARERRECSGLAVGVE